MSRRGRAHGFTLIEVLVALTIVAVTLGAGIKAAGALTGMIFGVGAIVILPVFYGVMGFVMTAFTAWLYNIMAGLVGGIEIEVEQR